LIKHETAEQNFKTPESFKFPRSATICNSEKWQGRPLYVNFLFKRLLSLLPGLRPVERWSSQFLAAAYFSASSRCLGPRPNGLCPTLPDEK
jgi:hypothetical protein